MTFIARRLARKINRLVIAVGWSEHRRRKRGGRGGGDVSPPKFQVGGYSPPKFQFFFFFFFACHPGGRCCVPRVPLPNNVNDVRKLSGKTKMGGTKSPPPLISFFGSCASDFILSQAWKNHARPPPNTLNFGLPPSMGQSQHVDP